MSQAMDLCPSFDTAMLYRCIGYRDALAELFCLIRMNGIDGALAEMAGALQKIDPESPHCEWYRGRFAPDGDPLNATATNRTSSGTTRFFVMRGPLGKKDVCLGEVWFYVSEDPEINKVISAKWMEFLGDVMVKLTTEGCGDA